MARSSPKTEITGRQDYRWKPIEQEPPAWTELNVLLQDRTVEFALWTGKEWSRWGKAIEPISWRLLKRK